MEKIKLFILACALVIANAAMAQYPINFSLAQSGRVSVNIYNANGNIVRELLHAGDAAANLTAGNQTITWDGKDNKGVAVPNAAACNWKLLNMPAPLKANWISSLGASLPYSESGNWWTSTAGACNHTGILSIASDGANLYALGHSENRRAGFKMSFDGSTCNYGDAWASGSSFTHVAVMGGKKYHLSCKWQPSWPETFITSFSTATGNQNWYSDNPQTSLGTTISNDVENRDLGMDAYDNGGNPQLVLSSSATGKIYWISPNPSSNTAFSIIDNANVAGATDVTIDKDGNILTISNGAVVKLSRTNKTPVVLISSSNLTSPTHLTTDRSNGNILVTQGGSNQQIKRFSSTGTLLNTYGVLGGRTTGLYNPKAFFNVKDIVTDASGGFFVAEPQTAPRRIARFDASGNLIKEWYTGTPWAANVCIEPDNPNAVWVQTGVNGPEFGDSWWMRIIVNPTTHTFTVHSVYNATGLANGLIGDQLTEFGTRVIKQKGNKYLAVAGSNKSAATIIKIDTVNWKLIPSTILSGYYYDNQIPAQLKPWAGSNNCYQWNDANGDGIPQENECIFYPTTRFDYTQGSKMGDNLDFLACRTTTNYAKTQDIIQYSVSSWTAAGAPVYNSYPLGTIKGQLPSRYVECYRSPFMWLDASTNSAVAAVNVGPGQGRGWGDAGDAFITKFNLGTSKEVWQTGKGTGFGANQNSPYPPPPGQINAFNAFVGQARGCYVANDYNGGWTLSTNPTTYVVDADGLWVGGIFDQVDTSFPKENYGLQGDNLTSTIYEHPVTKEVYYVGSGEDQGHLYKITGWDNWEKKSGPVVSVSVTSVSVSPPSSTVSINGTQQLTPTVSPSNATNQSVTWSSSNTSVATVSTSGLVTGKAAGTATITVTTADGNKTATSSITVNTGSTGSGDGLKGDYYNTKDLSGTVAVTRTDATVNFDWGTGSYATGQPVDNFSTRWTGQILPKYTETYTFETETDDGVRLWVNDVQLINKWVDQGPTKVTGTTISLTAGTKYDIKMEYYENGGGAVSRLRWSSASQVYEVIPQSQLFSAVTAADISVLTTQVPATSDNDQPYELGMKFSSTQAGSITKVRYYKMSGEGGTHTGRIWSSTGTQLASVVFSDETVSGWQVAALATPLSITANTTYVVSVNNNNVYAVTSSGLQTSIVNGPLSSIADGANGVYNTTPGSFPNSNYNNTDYFRDIVFVSTSALRLATESAVRLPIETDATNDIVIYPNPTTGEFQIEFANEGPSDVIITNSSGQSIVNFKRVGNINEKINLSNHGSGLYLLRVQNGKEVRTKKIVMRK